MPIHQISAGVFATCLVHQSARHGYTGGIPDIGGYGGGIEANRIAQPFVIARGREISSRIFAPLAMAIARLGEDYLELYEPGDTSVPIRSIPFFWYTKGQDMDLTYDLWFSRDQLSLDADEVRLSAYIFGASNTLGQEIVANGYLKAKLSTSSVWSPLTVSTDLSLGNFLANSKKTLNLRLNIPLGAASKGFIILGLKIQVLRSAIYGTLIHGTFFYGAQEKFNLDTLTARIHIFAKT